MSDKLIEETYSTKNVGLFGYSFVSYLTSKAKSFFHIYENKKDTSLPVVYRNNIMNRVSIVQCSANNPVEDRFNAIQLKNLNSYFISVLDGHGGNQVADFVNKQLHIYFDERIKYLENSNYQVQHKIKESFLYAFESVVRYLNIKS